MKHLSFVVALALAAKHPDDAAWLSVGRNMQMVLGDEVYELVD